jgi:3-methylcrotonyl-CoA carboxylase alpha subunit
VLIEKYVQRPRHIEIQVFGDTLGNYVYLFERDCSVQRRHQKVLEEAPAPGMTPAMRQQMGEAAVAAARAVEYVGAGTVEFIVEQRADGSMNFFFMEMNTRLQVEHPVTEAITGLDLVEWQLRVASGEPLPLKQEDLRITGHAIEARICAENPDNNFLPATGTLAVYRKPACTAFERGTVRVDDGVREGDAISPFYDSMIAKLIVHGATRAEALARLDEALARTHIVGLATNVQFLRHVVRSPSFAQANLDTALIPREQAVLFHQEPVGLPLAAAAAVAQTLLDEKAAEGPDPFSRRDGWRSHGVTVRRFAFEFHGEPAPAELSYLHDGALHLSVGGAAGPLWFAMTPQGHGRAVCRAARHRGRVRAGRDRPCIRPAGGHPDPEHRPAGPCRRGPCRSRPPDGADAGQGGVVCGEGRRPGPQGPGAGRDGSHEDGAHHRRARRRHGSRAAVRPG